MKLTIHRGTNEIGGICIEIRSENSKILLDFGIPLVSTSGGSFDFKQYKNLSVNELIANGVLPDITSAYSEKTNIDGVLISHPHADHFGLLHYLNNDIPVFLGKATHEIVKLNNIFLNQNNYIENHVYFEKNNPFQIGAFTVTPYWNDHSAFDSYSFLIEAEGKSIFYSGDFRGHGRKEKVFRWFIHNVPKSVDCLLIEGTTIGRTGNTFKTEQDIERDFVEIFRNSDCINYIYTSSQNIDRIVSLYKACLKSGKTFVVDVYTANVLNTVSKFAQLPTPLKNYKQLMVMFPQKITNKLFELGFGDLVDKFAKKKIKKEEIAKNPVDYVVIVRPSMKIDLKKIVVDKGNLIYSMWDGYKKHSSTKEFMDWLHSRKFSIIDIHTSGHADRTTLKKLADAVNPGVIIPIHTFNKQDYKNVFSQTVIELDDKQEIEI